MTPQSPVDWPDPLPQVGAVLYLDSEIGPDPPDYTGGKHWKLTGSCVLVAPDRILTIGHTLAARSEILPAGRYAAFFPYIGLIPVNTNLEWETNQTRGDNLALATLEGRVEHLPPLRPYKILSSYKYSKQALVCGYGRWVKSPLGDHEGLQQQHLVSLGPSEEGGWEHYDNLDLSWSSREHGDMAAGRGNSGGPFLWSESHEVVGISREVAGDQQIGSWIGHDRMEWLQKLVTTDGSTPDLTKEWSLLTLTPDKGEVRQFSVPKEAKRVRATLNASPGLRLRMEMTPLVGEPKTSTGRFLCRESELPEGTKEVVIRVDRAPRSPYQTGKQVLAQLCVLFE